MTWHFTNQPTTRGYNRANLVTLCQYLPSASGLGQLTGASTENRPRSLRPDTYRANSSETNTPDGQHSLRPARFPETGQGVSGFVRVL